MEEHLRTFVEFVACLTGKEETKRGLEDLERTAKRVEKSTKDLTKTQEKLGASSKEVADRQKLLGRVSEVLKDSFKLATQELGKNTREVAKNMVATKNGFRVTMTYTNGLKILSRTAEVTEKGVRVLGTSIREVGTEFKSGTPLIEQFLLALRRVAIVLPVWFVARRLMMGFINTIQEGIRYLYEMDKAFTKASLVIHTLEDVDRVNRQLQEGFKNLALLVGESATDVAKAFYRFGTLGIEAGRAWAGAQASIKQAVATMGDIDTIARANALAISLLGDTLGDYLPEQEMMNFFAAKQVVLWRYNLMEANEFAQALERFLPTAKTLNLTLDQTIALLATLHSAGIRSSRAGRLLRTTFLKMIQNLPQVGKELGLIVREGADTFDTLMLILERINKVWKETGGRLSPNLNRLFRQIFGGIRSQEVARALTVMYDVLKRNIDLINAEGIPTQEKISRIMEEFRKQLEKVTDSYHKLIDINKQLRKRIGTELVEAFLRVITYSDDSREAIRRLNEFFKALLETLEFIKNHSKEVALIFGALAGVTIPALIQKISALRKALITLKAVIIATGTNIKVVLTSILKHPLVATVVAIIGTVLYLLDKYREKVEKLSETNKKFAEATKDVREGIKEVAKALKEAKTPEQFAEAQEKLRQLMKTLEGVKKTIEEKIPLKERPKYLETIASLYKALGDLSRSLHREEAERTKETAQNLYTISAELKEQLDLLDKSVKYLEMEATGYSRIEIANEKLIDYVDELVNQYNRMVDITRETNKEKAKGLEHVSREQILALLTRREYDKIKEVLNLQEKDERKILKLRQLQLDILKEQFKLIQSYSSQLRETFQSALVDLFKTQDIDKFFTTIKDKFASLYYESVAKYITSTLEKSTGIFKTLGEYFAGIELGTMGRPIVTASEIGSKKYYDAIVEASEVGSRLYGGTVEETVRETTVGRRNPFQPPEPIAKALGEGAQAIKEAGEYIKESAKEATGRAPTLKPYFPTWFPFSARLNRIFGGYIPMEKPNLGRLAIGAIATGAVTGNWEGALTSFIGSALMNVNPLLGLGFMLVGSLFKKKKVVRTTSWTNPQEAKNLLPYLGITPPPIPEKVYALPSSYTFVSNITVHIDKVEGERPDIVNEIAENVRTTMQEQVAKEYYHSLLRSIRPKSVGF